MLAENYFVAVAYRRGRRGLFVWRHSPTVRYLTLEYGINLETKRSRTVLGEWTLGGHINYGNGPDPDLGEFRRALHPILSGSVIPVATYTSPLPRGRR